MAVKEYNPQPAVNQAANDANNKQLREIIAALIQEIINLKNKR